MYAVIFQNVFKLVKLIKIARLSAAPSDFVLPLVYALAEKLMGTTATLQESARQLPVKIISAPLLSQF